VILAIDRTGFFYNSKPIDSQNLQGSVLVLFGQVLEHNQAGLKSLFSVEGRHPYKTSKQWRGELSSTVTVRRRRRVGEAAETAVFFVVGCCAGGSAAEGELHCGLADLVAARRSGGRGFCDGNRNKIYGERNGFLSLWDLGWILATRNGSERMLRDHSALAFFILQYRRQRRRAWEAKTRAGL